jgi:hypothetical protein
MPEPTTGPISVERVRLIGNLLDLSEEWDAHEAMVIRGFVRDLLAAYDKTIVGRETWRAKALKMEADRDRLADRAAAAEAAVQRVRERAEREYVISLNAVLASPNENADVHRWRGHAEALRQVAEQCCLESGVTVPAYRSDEWRLAHGVYTPEQIAQWGPGSTGQFSADSARTTIADILANTPDDQPVTIHGHVRHVEVRENRAGAPYLELTLADLETDLGADLENDPDTLTVAIPPSVYAHMNAALMPREGTLLRVTGRTHHEVRIVAHDVTAVEQDEATR